MTITSLTQAVRDPERVNIFIDGEFGFAVDKSTLAKHMLHREMEVSEEFVNQLIQEDTAQYLYRRMLDYWFKKPRSGRELRTKIQERIRKREERLEHKPSRFSKNIDNDLVTEQVLEKMRSQGYDDAAFAEWFASERARQGKYGGQRVLSELLSKGVSRELANNAIKQHFTDDTQLAQKLLQKKYGVDSIKEITDLKLRAKAYRYLAGRGVRSV